MEDIRKIVINSLDGQKVYGIEDSEVREELANVVDGAPEELDSFKEAFEKFKEGGEALAGIADEVAAVGKAVADETARAEQAEKELGEKINNLPQGGGGGSAVAELMQEVTYSELVALRDNNNLLAGMKYRITDYVTTTVQKDTKSANHPFDIIVEAISGNELSELAQAIQHEGDTYFDGNDLSAWQLWYDLDNNTDKYKWADAENGKGVIYRMIDEKRNDCPYDFKNILFYTTNYINNTTFDRYYYTFSYVVSGVLYDGTIEKRVISCRNNSIEVYRFDSKSILNGNIFRNTIFENDCCNNAFGNGCYYNTFENGCFNNTFENDCFNNTFGDYCCYNTFGNGCYYNTFGDYCYYNTFGHRCYNNTFINDCYYNTFGHHCNYNTLGHHCYNNTFGNVIYGRKLDNDRTSITLNEEYYDDGTNALVPIKHPDLSTQPSILPYKFMGQYVYEQLIPIDSLEQKGGGFSIPKDLFSSNETTFFDCAFVGHGFFLHGSIRPFESGHLAIGTGSSDDAVLYKYIKIVYSTIPEEGGDYNYNNY